MRDSNHRAGGVLALATGRRPVRGRRRVRHVRPPQPAAAAAHRRSPRRSITPDPAPHGAGHGRRDLQRDPQGRSAAVGQQRDRRRTRAPDRQADQRPGRELAAGHHRVPHVAPAPRAASAWDPARRPQQGEAPYAWVGMNILVEFGPIDRRAGRAGCRPASSRRRTWSPSSTRCCGRSSSARSTPIPTKTAPPAASAGRPRPARPPSAGAVTRRSPAHLRPLRRRGLRPRQADHRAPPAGRPAAVHPDRGGPRRVRGCRPGPDEPPRRAGDPPGRRRHRPAEARLPADGDDRDPLRGRPADGRRRAGCARSPRSTTS